MAFGSFVVLLAVEFLLGLIGGTAGGVAALARQDMSKAVVSEMGRKLTLETSHSRPAKTRSENDLFAIPCN